MGSWRGHPCHTVNKAIEGERGDGEGKGGRGGKREGGGLHA